MTLLRLVNSHRYISRRISVTYLPKLLHRTMPLARDRSLIFRCTPPSLHPYIQLSRLDSSTGTWLVYLPCTWSIAIASPVGSLPAVSTLALFGMGALLMRGAGCTVNDMWDKDYDKHVSRTKDRPLASGSVSMLQSTSFLGVQLSAALMILLQLNWLSVAIGALSLLPVVVYPLFKRFTYWPQLALGVTLNWGTLVGYTAVQGVFIAPICLPLHIFGTLLTITYDSIYSHQDIKDDLLLGLKSTAILFGDSTKKWLSLAHVAMWGCLLVVGINSDATCIYYGGSTLTMLYLAKQLYDVNLKEPTSCLKSFKSNRNTGLFLFFSIVLDRLLHPIFTM